MTSLDKASPFPFGAKSIIFKLDKHTIGRVVVQQGNINILRSYTRSSKRFLSSLPRWCCGDRAHRRTVANMLSRVGLAKPQNRHWTVRMIACPRKCSNHKSGATVKKVGEVILAQGGNQQRCAFVFFQSQRG